MALELLDIVEPNEPTHRIADDVELSDLYPREDRIDLLLNDERRGADVTRIEPTQVERKHGEAILTQPLLERIKRSAVRKKAVQEQDRSPSARIFFEKLLLGDPVSTHK